jgi:hypothetical protein
MSIVVGVAAILAGIYTLIYTGFHRQLENRLWTRAPWFYWPLNKRLATATGLWRVINLAGGVGLIIVGIRFLIYSPSS